MNDKILAWAALAIVLSACGGSVVDSSGAGGSTATTTTTASSSSTGTTTAAECAGLDFCGCSHTEGCKVVYGDCICGCDYQCAGEPPCVCACGGGPYFGCAPETCPGPFSFEGTAMVTFDAQGCPAVLK